VPPQLSEWCSTSSRGKRCLVYKRQARVRLPPEAGHKLRAAAYRSQVPVSREPDLVLLVVMVHWLQLPVSREPDLVLLVVRVHWLQVPVSREPDLAPPVVMVHWSPLPAPKGPDLMWPVVMVKR
jgi:hypothetical protein